MTLSLLASAILTTTVATPPPQSVTITVHNQGSPTATWAAIDNALAAVSQSGGTIEFADPMYEVDAPFVLGSTAGRLHLVSTATGTRAAIRYVGPNHIARLFTVNEPGADIAIEGLEFDGNLTTAVLFKVQRVGSATEYPTTSVLARDCAFRNGRQRVFDTGTLANGVEVRLGHEEGAAGLYVNGAFADVTVQSCSFEDFGHTASTVMPAVSWNVGSRGAWLTCEVDPLPATPGQFTERPRRYDVLDCLFRDITSSKLQHVAGVLVPVDADGLHISALRPAAGAVAPHRAATAVVRGCRFEHCEYRSVKLQIGRAIVTENSFLRTTHGQCEIDAQHAGADITANTILVANAIHLQGAGLIQGAFRSSTAEPMVFTDNHIVAAADTNPWAVFAISSNGPDLGPVRITDNFVKGITRSFLHVWQPPPGGRHRPVVVRNSVTGITSSFVEIAAQPGAVVAGVYAANESALPGQQLMQFFQPECWVANARIGHPTVY